MAAKMLCAYYDQSCSSDSLFSDLQIASDPTYPTHLNKYPVIYLDMTFFTTNCKNQDTMVEWMDRWIKSDLQKAYPEGPSAEGQPLISYLLALAEHQSKRFIMIIDEWDAICRETAHSSELMHRYVDWLRSMFKSSNTDRVFAGVYMTGILPIKQYDTQSALNNFTHYSVLDPEPLQGYFGFTEEETRALCSQTGMNYRTLEQWYDGYEVGGMRIFNPNSVAKALKKRTYSNYWMQDTLESNETAVAQAIEKTHQDNTSIIRYNDENSLSCVLSLAYYTAQKDYTAIRELPTGKGFADIVLIPRPGIRKPAIVLELKWDKSVRTAINQIKEKDYKNSRSSQGALKE